MFHSEARISCADWEELELELELEEVFFEMVEAGLGIGGTVCAFGEIWERGFGAIVGMGMASLQWMGEGEWVGEKAT